MLCGVSAFAAFYRALTNCFPIARRHIRLHRDVVDADENEDEAVLSHRGKGA